jgi:hypothetical protein
MVIVAFQAATGLALAQNAAPTDNNAVWRPANEQPAATVPATPAPEPVAVARRSAPATPSSAPTRPLARVPSGDAMLPSDGGQVWREYDISEYTTRVTTTKRPEQAIVDWILRETGYEAWHGETLSILNASPRMLRVYHTPKMQEVVADLVDRFINSAAATYTFSLRVVTLDNPNWRTTAQRLIQPIPVQTAGINAWVMPRENAAVLLGELKRRNDYREHSSPYLMVNNGQSTVVSSMRGRSYVRDLMLRPDTPNGFDPSPGQVDEGFNLDFSPLMSFDRRTIDAMVKCDVDQVEKMIPVIVDVPTQAMPRQRTKIEVPQMTHYRFHERFRWPVDQVLLIGMGMVALPIPVDGAPIVSLPIGNTPPRADLLVFVECKGATLATTQPTQSPTAPRSAHRDAKNYRGRY